MRTLKILALGLMLTGPAMAAEVYKWVDPAGRIHYGDRPQDGWKRVDIKPPGGAAPAAAAPGIDQAACDKKTKNVAEYKDAGRIVERDSLGREKEYSEEERKQLIELAQKQADEACTVPAAAKAP
ncbi:DUF4124 domain-containing protein [Solimonas sp. K1W22B-7]|uniref:DUF4124 domain-containing protein n=1 Tax=Solimonas sp. K1W22B-7 TaxID=2303331 RepID=UPI000E331D8F|nr:DUF4124 domain-containing protein [Solimonas sp. K1W22B-7]AXQ31256.1 DUF4124 domain-containing protein [Solimonas sp. K1W22B-7]